MSCGRPVDESDEIALASISTTLAKTCTKCSIEPAQIVTLAGSLCSACLKASVTTKLRTSLHRLEAPRRLGRADKSPFSLAIAFSGGPASRLLLELIRPHVYTVEERPLHYRGPPSHALFARAQIIYVSSGSAVIDDQVKTVANDFDYPFCTVTLPVEAVELAANALDPSAKMTLQKNLSRSLITRTAHEQGVTHLMMGETSTGVAIRTIAGMSVGAGFNLGEQVATHVPLFNDKLQLVRPLAHVSSREVAFLVKQLGLRTIFVPNDLTMAKAKGKKEMGIDGTVEEFVLGLEQQFPATSSVVGRTAAKLSLCGATSTLCSVCGLPADANASTWRHATALSSFTEHDDLTPSEIASPLCYSCGIATRKIA
ncbi:uncharacterized protein L969DRAFT_93802 [Mixia osmundae IAM 14324]|uniref:Cytoplasmic tRNA 2-thiolation protein 2 n=1 Tax=Mixia osmundae (strain CBS 9802 / IAM 14324 / JCM 22182 / KY 12970) TaxID=764103 RepID=G7E9M2_MIXOS|nr:uncharacterized protein L969DRAFT_93802 [Mixia osmundae IAM 14324]KEI39971.1 hypothetical protein L969DRAFT_93802 [Mixia osmundae IAM 14324]GAA99341.1 hypothetical protein E5Q_06036 [Mixia osmundae IAM 14324]